MDQDIKASLNMMEKHSSHEIELFEEMSSHEIELLVDMLEASDKDYDQLVPKLKRLRVFLDDPPPSLQFPLYVMLRSPAFVVEDVVSDPAVLNELSSQIDKAYILLMDSVAIKVFREMKSSMPLSSKDKFLPRIDQIGFIKHLVGHMEEVLQRKANSIRPLKHEVQQVQHKFKGVLYCLMEIPECIWEEFQIHDLLTRISNLAYEAEYLIDGILVRNKPLWYSMYWLIDIDIQLDHHLDLITSKNWIKQLMISHDGPNDVQVVSYLLSDPIVSVFCGDLLYSSTFGFDSTSGKGFDAFLVCDIGEIYKKNVLICSQIVDGKAKMASQSYISIDEYESLVAEILPGRRYLVVVMVLNENQALVDMLSSLPENNDGSRIVVVTSSQEMLVRIQKCPCVRLLLEEGSSVTSMLMSPATDGNKIHIKTDEVVGFKDESERMMNWLLGGERRPLEIASIFGMAGQGKTTLANKLFKMASGSNKFHISAWCCVSQVYKLRQLLLELLSQVVYHNYDFSSFKERSDSDLKEMLKKNLLGRTYFIVMDDIWDLMAWDELGRCFPNQKNGSCIVFTTRIQDLASKARRSSFIQQPLSPLSDEESWELFKMQLFLKKSCSFIADELHPIAREITKNCKGLPLAIVLSAGLVSKIDDFDNVAAWEKIAKTLSQQILEDSEAYCQGVLELSYKHLPDNLKACFLYIGALPENDVIPVTKISKLWIAEGFIHSTHLDRLVKTFDQHKFSFFKSPSELTAVWETDWKELCANMQKTSSEEGNPGEAKFCPEEIIDRIEDIEEEIAEAYLMELVQRSLVQVVSQKSKGGVKACQVHDLLRSFCLMKASEDNFLLHQVICNKGYDIPHFPIDFSHFYRLSISFEGNEDLVMSKPSEPNLRSLLFSAAGDYMCYYWIHDMVHFICDNFKFLKILNLEGIDIGESFWEITKLVHLRYLAVQCRYEDRIPNFIDSLWNLETLIVIREGSSSPILVPDSIWNMAELRYVNIFNSLLQINPDRIENESSLLENLHSLCNVSLPHEVDMEKFLQKFPNLRKLNCRWDDTVSCNKFLKLESLDHLESLKVFYTGGGNCCIVNFPLNLIKLSLSNFRMPWKDISLLTKLSKLRVLKLTSEAFEGVAWEMQEDEEAFPNLRFLKLDNLNLERWIAFESSFPLLEQLVLHRCKQLQEIPAGIGVTQTLQRIEVMWCNRSTAISARKIQKEQLEYGNEYLKIHVHPREMDDCQNM